MASAKSPGEERRVIVTQPAKRPYGVMLRLHVQSPAAFGQVEDACVPFATGAFLTIAPAEKAPWEGGSKYSLTLEGFATAAAAEIQGRRLVQAVLWMAISSDAAVRLDYQSYEPFSVFERTRSRGFGAHGYAETFFRPSTVFGEVHDAYVGMEQPDPTLLLSMEIFSGAGLEVSDRARFLAVVSALEPLAQEQALGDQVDGFVDSCTAKLKNATGITPQVRASLEGRVSQLRTESIRQALRRVVREALPNQPEAVDLVDDAYAIRSQIVHSGRPADLDLDLERETRRVSNVIRAIYASRAGRTLLKPLV